MGGNIKILQVVVFLLNFLKCKTIFRTKFRFYIALIKRYLYDIQT